MLRFLFRHLKGYRFLTLIAVIMVVAQVSLDLLGAFPLKFDVDKIQKNVDPPIFFNSFLRFFDHWDATQHLSTRGHSLSSVIMFSVALQILLGLVGAILTYVQLVITAFIARNMTSRLRDKLLGHLLQLAVDWHDIQKEGDLVQRIAVDTAYVERLIMDGIVFLFAGGLTLVGIVAVMLVLNWEFTLLAIIVMPILAGVVYFYTTAIKKASIRDMQTSGEMANIATEDTSAIIELKAFTLEEYEETRFGSYVRENRRAALHTSSLQAQFVPIVAILISIGTATIIGVGTLIAGGYDFKIGFLTISGNSLSIGDLTVFLVYLRLLYQPLREISKLTNITANAVSGAERIEEVLNQTPEVSESTAAYHYVEKIKGEITFENVVFGYSECQPVLKGINLQVPAGKKIALVGLSGGGKTTLVKLIPRFYEIQQGSIKIDGVDNRMYPLKVLRHNISMVLQDNVLFEGTIRENIGIGKPGAALEEIIEAAKKTGIHETIMNMQDGYNTRVHRQGKNLSGGQRQRLAIARAILRDTPILILDEPSAALDVEAEAEIMHALDNLIVGRTVLMISHRLSTLGSVDEIVVLQGGRIVEQGTFKDLKLSGGVFAGLLEKQNRYNPDLTSNLFVN